jgi:hypothetical protein
MHTYPLISFGSRERVQHSGLWSSQRSSLSGRMVRYDCDDWHWHRALQSPTHCYTAPIVLELFYIESGTDPPPSLQGSSPVGPAFSLASQAAGTRRFAACRGRSLAWTSGDRSHSSFTLPELEVLYDCTLWYGVLWTNLHVTAKADEQTVDWILTKAHAVEIATTYIHTLA